GHDHMAQRPALARDPPRQLDEVEVTGPVRDHVRDGFGQLYVIFDLAIPVRRQRHDRDRPDALEGEVDADELRYVRELNHHAVEGHQRFKRPTWRRAAAWSQ